MKRLGEDSAFWLLVARSPRSPSSPSTTRSSRRSAPAPTSSGSRTFPTGLTFRTMRRFSSASPSVATS